MLFDTNELINLIETKLSHKYRKDTNGYLVEARTGKKLSKSFKEYFNETDENGKRYVIPHLDITAPDYAVRYVDMMITKELNPQLFEKIINWD